jgi:hypothetical protein
MLPISPTEFPATPVLALMYGSHLRNKSQACCCVSASRNKRVCKQRSIIVNNTAVGSQERPPHLVN